MIRMTTQEIFEKCPEIKKHGHDWRAVYATVLHLTNTSNKIRLMRSGNSIFLIIIKGPHQAEVSMFNADRPFQFAKNFRDFAKAMDVAGYRYVTGVTDNLPTLQLIKRFGYPINIQTLGKDSKGVTQYRGTVHV